jgi:ribose 5-phosphate isomerase A
MNPKETAGEAALQYVKSGMNLGLGTGSTTDYFLIALGREIKAGKLTGIKGVPTSIRSQKRADELGIPTCQLHEVPHLDVAVDGADEVDPHLDLIKGLGGALLREKMIAQAARVFVVIADSGKKVKELGTHVPLPVEVIQFGHESTAKFLATLQCVPTLRPADPATTVSAGGKPYVTDNGNYIYDCRFKRIVDAMGLDRSLKGRAGVVETGLFIDMASVVLIAGESGLETLKG